MPRTGITVNTPDGQCPASLFTPENEAEYGQGPWPGVIFFMDGLGIRPTLWNMAQRLADHGYFVLLPDLYYRAGSYAPMEPAKVFADPSLREGLMKLLSTLNRERKISDAGAFLDFLAAHPLVKGSTFGCAGYCMGGNCALTAAGAFKTQLSASASFHGGNLATQDPDSPHQFLTYGTGRIYVAGASATKPKAPR